MTIRTTTPEQIAEAIRHLRSIGSFTRDSAYSICNEAADLIEALAAQLAEARGKIFGLEELLAQSSDIMRGYLERAEQAEAAAASEREILEAATAWREDLERDNWTKQAIEDGFSRQPIARLMKAVDAYRKHRPPAPPTPSTESEVMPNSTVPGPNTATPQASMLAPGADAPEPDFDARSKRLCEASVDTLWPYQKVIAIEFERFYRLGLTRAQGGKP